MIIQVQVLSNLVWNWWLTPNSRPFFLKFLFFQRIWFWFHFQFWNWVQVPAPKMDLVLNLVSVSIPKFRPSSGSGVTRTRTDNSGSGCSSHKGCLIGDVCLPTRPGAFWECPPLRASLRALYLYYELKWFVLGGNKYTNLQRVPQIMGHYKIWLAQIWNLKPLITAMHHFYHLSMVDWVQSRNAIHTKWKENCNNLIQCQKVGCRGIDHEGTDD